jgi:sulfite reductase (NADPH) flavoprotein alpha-component
MQQFSKDNPFLASIKDRRRLSSAASDKETYHISLDLRGSGYRYHPGDSVAIYSVNNPTLVERTLAAMGASGDELITDKKGACYGLRQFLSSKANLSEVSRRFFSEVADKQTDQQKREQLLSLLDDSNRHALKAYLEAREVWDFLGENEEVVFEPQQIVSLLMPLLPRFYSIASSQNEVGDEMHLTVAALSYSSNGHVRVGVCTNYLCKQAPLHEPMIGLYVQPHHGFTLPENNDRDIIMVGPGTGVAPFRAFMQERVRQAGKGRNWLFFGERRLADDFLYGDYWHELQHRGLLHMHTAFSRDQAEKIYVQHRMEENGRKLYEWLQNGAHLYVCGDAKRMAKDVEASLHRILEIHGGLSESDAKEYVKKMRAEKQYLRDVY